MRDLARSDFDRLLEEFSENDPASIPLAETYYKRSERDRRRRERSSKQKRRSRQQAPVPTSRFDINLAQARELLDLPEGTTQEEVRKRERALKQKVHPDRGGTNGLFRLVAHATGLVMEDLTEKANTE